LREGRPGTGALLISSKVLNGRDRPKLGGSFFVPEYVIMSFIKSLALLSACSFLPALDAVANLVRGRKTSGSASRQASAPANRQAA
jgi:hypothetical protein